MIRLLIVAAALAGAPAAWGDASPYCWPDVHFTAAPTRAESAGCVHRMRWFSRHYCRKNPGAALCVTGIAAAGCYTSYIPSKADCDAGRHVCSGLPAIPPTLEANRQCYFGGGDVNENVPARTDVLPIPPPPCGMTVPLIHPTRHALRGCVKRLAWFEEKLCANPANSGLPPCVLQVWTSSCLPYSPSDADCLAGHYVCAARADGSCDLS